MTTKRLLRDPNSPRRNLSAYLLYQNALRDQFKALNPGMTFGQLAKYTSAMYSELPPMEKDVWTARAEADKARYLHELALYIPPHGYDAKGDAIIAPIITKGGKKKPEKDILAPKKNQSAYLLYQNAMRDQFKRENPGMTFGQLSKYTSHMYKNLTPDEKATWEARAHQDKARFEAEISSYIPPPGHDARGVLIEDQRPKKHKKKGMLCCYGALCNVCIEPSPLTPFRTTSNPYNSNPKTPFASINPNSKLPLRIINPNPNNA
jgi:HMG (high mobility group) box